MLLNSYHCVTRHIRPTLTSLNARYLSIKVAVVGSGPASFYTTQKLLKNPDVNVDIYERLPVSIGRVRYGVAPDHADVKNVMNSFTDVANSDRVNFYGNVSLGQSISLDNLIEAYHAVVLCNGSAQDKLLDIEGETTTKNTISARNFVGWYNGVPEDKDLNLNLDCETACIIGQENVALDCARILLRPANLEKTDITTYAQQHLAKSRIKRIRIVGRRSPVQVAHTSSRKVQSILELMRWHQPTGTILALTPALWSMSLMTPAHSFMPDIETILIFSAGAIVARGMGCTLNDILDRKYDRLVERTKLRPIACGDISVKEGLVYLAIQSSLGLYILCLNNLAVIKLGLFSVILISTYPLFKRFTYWPQAMLAVTMNWGVLMGYAAVNGAIGTIDLITLLPIYMGSIFWTLYYDTIYAHQDKTDDLFIGVKSSALKLGSGTKRFLNQMSASMFLSLGLAGALTSQLWPYYLSIASTGLFQAHQIRKLNLDDKEECWKMFDQQKYVGFFILGGILFSVALKSRTALEKNTTTTLKDETKL